MAEIVGVWRVAGKKRETPSVSGVSAVERALSVLTAFRSGDSALTLAELAERTGLVKSTIMRVAVSLQRYKLLARLPDGSYRLDAEALRLGTAYQQGFSLADHVMPALERLAADTGETASFYVRHGDERLCLFRVESENPIRMHVQPGDTRPLDRSAVAQVLTRYAEGPRERWPGTGLVLYSAGASDLHSASLATPIFGPSSTLIGALAISGPVTRLSPDRAQAIKRLLAEAGAELTRACGGSLPADQEDGAGPELPASCDSETSR